MKLAISLAACSAMLGLVDSARAAGDYVSIVQETTLDVPAETAWARVKGYCQIGAWLTTSCEIISGKDGELGAVRRIGGQVQEVIVAATPLSYAYADVDPTSFYHGAVEVRPVSKTSSRLLYSLFFDQTAVPAQARQANTTQRQAVFADVLIKMKSAAERK